MATPTRKLPYSESDPPAHTQYEKIILLPHPSPPNVPDSKDTTKMTDMTGIFFSQHYSPTMLLDMILYLRGQEKNNRTIDKFWRAQLLREAVNLGGKSIVFVAPSLGPNCESGFLATDPDRYLDQVLDKIANSSESKWPGTKQIGSLVLAAHSSGGNQMLKVMKKLQRYQDKIKEIWGFDCVDGGTNKQEIVNWANKHRHARVYYYYSRKRVPTDKETQNLQKLAKKAGLVNPGLGNKFDPTSGGNMLIFPVKEYHDKIPPTYLAIRVKEAALTEKK